MMTTIPSEKNRDKRDRRIAEALAVYQQNWFAGREIAPREFCQNYPQCAPELLRKIENFLLVAEIITAREKEMRP